MGLTKHVQAYSMSYYTLFNEKTIKKLSCSTYIQNPQKTPFYTLVPLQLSPCPKLCTIMYVVCTKLNYASDWSWWRRWRVWSIYQMRHSQNSQKKPSMACLINLLNNGVNGVDGFDGVNGVFDNLPVMTSFTFYQWYYFLAKYKVKLHDILLIFYFQICQ